MLRIFVLCSVFIGSQSTAQPLPQKTISKNTVSDKPKKPESPLPDIQTIQKNLSQFDFLSTDFTLISYKKMRNITSEKTGVSDFAKPHQFRIVFLSPEKKSLIFDGDSLFEVRDDKKEGFRFSSKNSKELAQMKEIAQMMINFQKLSERFEVKTPVEITSSTPTDRRISIELKPLQDQDMLRVQLNINIKINLVEKVRLEFKDGNYTEYHFANPKRLTLPASTFKAPEGYKISEGLR